MNRHAGLRVLGDLLVTVGVVLALFAVYEVFYTGIYTGSAQTRLHDDLDRQWAAPPSAGGRPATPVDPRLSATVRPGAGLAVLHVPRLGRAYDKVIVEGVGVADLRKGPGHYPGTALPGRVGNFVVSGHRTTYGAPFGNLDRLRVGDPIVVETRDDWYVYRTTGQRVVAPDTVDVTDPVPFRPGARATRAVLTFTTCHPRYSARQRLVVFGVLSATRPRTAGPPAVLAG